MAKRFDAFFARLFAGVVDHPWPVLVFLGITILAAGLHLPKSRIVTDIKSMLPYDEVYRDDERIRETFDIRDYILIGIQHDHNVLNPRTFDFLETLIRKIESVEGVYSIRSLFSDDNIRNTPGKSLDISPFVKESTSEALRRAEHHLRSFEAVHGLFVSRDFTVTTLLIETQQDAEKSGMYFAIKSILDAHPPPDGEGVFIAGMPVLEGVLGEHMLRDLVVMIPIVSILVLAFLYVTYHSLLLVGLCAVIILAVADWTMGCMAYLGYPLYVVQCAMPVILVALSVADEIHIFSRYADECAARPSSNRARILITMQEMWRPVVLTSVTTACGFLALTMTSMRPIRLLGIFTAFGILCAMLFAVFVTPAVLSLFGDKENHRASHRVLDAFLRRAGGILYRNNLWTALAILLLVLFSAGGMLYVEVQDSWINNFKKTSVVSTDDQALNHKLAGTNVTYVQLDTGTPDGIKDPAFLQRLQGFHEYLKTVEGIGASLSLVQIIEKMHLEIEGAADVPESPEAVAQYLMLLEGTSYDRFWDDDYQKVNIALFGKNADYQFGRGLYRGLTLYLEKHFPDCELSYGGELRLSYHWVSLLQRDQISSFFTALLLIYLVSTGVFWSFKKGLIVVSPIVLAVAMNYGIMGFSGIDLSVSVSVFSAIIMGIGVDYAIHLQNKFDVLSREMRSSDVMPAAFTTAGKAIVWNACVVIGGFSVLLLSETPPIQKLGLVCLLGMLTSMLATFLLAPLLSVVRRKEQETTASPWPEVLKTSDDREWLGARAGGCDELR